MGDERPSVDTMGTIDDWSADLPCQGCGGKIAVKATELSPGKEVTCQACGVVTTISTKRGDDPGKALRELSAAFKAFGRRR